MEKSDSGAPIYRHQPKENRKRQVPTESSSADEVVSHIEQYVGNPDRVFHELVSDAVHIDIHWVKPTEDRPYHTLITSGMSDLPMTVPEGLEDHQYAELSLCLPQAWDLSEEGLKQDENYWPIRSLKYLAHFPHVYQTWLGFGHTIPNGDPAIPFASDVAFNTMLLLPTVLFDEGFRELQLTDKKIHFYTLVPLYQEEVDLKLKKGVNAIYKGFDKYKLSDIILIFVKSLI
ncbi:MAG: suppressor of fused domain protein [Bacteroidota bacterium]